MFRTYTKTDFTYNKTSVIDSVFDYVGSELRSGENVYGKKISSC